MAETLLSYPHAHVRPDWLARVVEDIIEPGLPIIDPHHHLWFERPSGRYMPEELFADLTGGHAIKATVFVQCGWRHRTTGPEALRPAGETEVVNAVAILAATGAYGPARACAGIVGWADLRRPDLDETLDAHVAAAPERFRGVRQVAAHDDRLAPTTSIPPTPGLLADPAFVAGLKRLGERGLTFDSWQFHGQLPALAAAARSAPGTTIIVDHVGGPLRCVPYTGQDESLYPVWRKSIADLAACPNVFMKLGGLGMPVNGFDYDKDDEPPTSQRVAADWRPWIMPCIELFGPSRCMFESNFPVDKGMVSYGVVWNAFKRLAEGASASEKAALFHDTAASVYRI